MDKKQAAQFNGAHLAYLGDAQFELLVRKRMLSESGKLGEMNKKADALACAGAQSKAADRLLPLFTEEEAAIYRRGKNIHTNSIPKNATSLQYRKATGLEAVFGYLSLTDQTERMNELFEMIYSEEQTDGSEN